MLLQTVLEGLGLGALLVAVCADTDKDGHTAVTIYRGCGHGSASGLKDEK